MNIAEALKEMTDRLGAASVESSALDAEVLLAHSLGVERYRLLVDRTAPVDPVKLSSCRRLVARRCAGEPVAYITGRKEFYSLEFLVTPDVLIPRPETELLVDMALYYAAPGAGLLDLGTGSGAIAVAVRKNREDIKVSASDISAAALRIARRNCRRIMGDMPIVFRIGDLFSPFEGKRFDVIASNPPYVDPALKPTLQREIRFEPEHALFADDHGRAVLRRIVISAEAYLRPGGIVLLEIGHDMRDFILEAGARAGYVVSVLNDLAGCPRVALLKR
ncbi:MAG: peptide chain release factor N(5)-glutamine methyltransferase [Spirochaetales bacterium]|nr:MAG: peptide chain release factor N(5)-glutamine methyltransferase [Spirochaetales bacterium]